jgi:isoleucyl-tRNA synthetase
MIIMIFFYYDSVDGITIPSKQGNGDLRRIEEVFDCWFESGR